MSAAKETVKTTFCLVSDTHDHGPKPASADRFAFREPLPCANVLLHAGDLTMIGGLKEHQKVLEWIKKADAELKIVIAGNHDIDLHSEYYLRHAEENELEDTWKRTNAVKELWTGLEAKNAGVIYLDEGLNTFTLRNGATFTTYTSPWQPEYFNWAFNYPHDVDRFNPAASPSEPSPANPIPSWPTVDIMLTHGPPWHILDKTDRDDEVGCRHLLKAVKRVRPRLHCFGHIHEGWGAEKHDWQKNTIQRVTPNKETTLKNRSARLPYSSDDPEPLSFGKETIFVNASIMNLSYVPVNAPWLVDLDLPLKQDG